MPSDGTVLNILPAVAGFAFWFGGEMVKEGAMHGQAALMERLHIDRLDMSLCLCRAHDLRGGPEGAGLRGTAPTTNMTSAA
jgi:hypothetical protein